MNESEFRNLLDNFDWYYNMSDDHKVWLRESAIADRIHKVCEDQPEFRPIFEEVRYEKTGYRGSAFPGAREL